MLITDWNSCEIIWNRLTSEFNDFVCQDYWFLTILQSCFRFVCHSLMAFFVSLYFIFSSFKFCCFLDCFVLCLRFGCMFLMFVFNKFINLIRFLPICIYILCTWPAGCYMLETKKTNNSMCAHINACWSWFCEGFAGLIHIFGSLLLRTW